MLPFRRRQTPPEPVKWQKTKPFLRLDFDQRCAFCLVPESHFGSPGNFHIDHFRPKSLPQFSHLVNDYNNLYYVCADCNRFKSNTWPSPELEHLGFFFLDPCKDDPVGHWWVNLRGFIQPASRAGEYTIARINLNRALRVEWRIQKDRYQALRNRTFAAIQARPPHDEETRAALSDCLAELDRKLSDYGPYW
jgi:hypothetical protein